MVLSLAEMLVRGGCNIDVGQYLLTLVSGTIFGRLLGFQTCWMVVLSFGRFVGFGQCLV